MCAACRRHVACRMLHACGLLRACRKSCACCIFSASLVHVWVHVVCGTLHFAFGICRLRIDAARLLAQSGDGDRVCAGECVRALLLFAARVQLGRRCVLCPHWIIYARPASGTHARACTHRAHRAYTCQLLSLHFSSYRYMPAVIRRVSMRHLSVICTMILP